jgi:FtsZ-binding cell division protein ZapB
MKTTLTQNEILDYKIQEYQDRIDELKDRNNELSNAVSNNKDYNAIYEIYENECRIEEYIEKIVELESKRNIK